MPLPAPDDHEALVRLEAEIERLRMLIAVHVLPPSDLSWDIADHVKARHYDALRVAFYKRDP